MRWPISHCQAVDRPRKEPPHRIVAKLRMENKARGNRPVILACKQLALPQTLWARIEESLRCAGQRRRTESIPGNCAIGRDHSKRSFFVKG